jgi:hypothetical protein
MACPSLGTMLLTDTGTYDFELVIKTHTADYILKTHRLVLKAVSGYFRRVLCGPHFFTWSWNVPSDRFESAIGLVQFMYTSDTSDLVNISHTLDLCIELEMPAYYVWISNWQALLSADAPPTTHNDNVPCSHNTTDGSQSVLRQVGNTHRNRQKDEGSTKGSTEGSTKGSTEGSTEGSARGKGSTKGSAKGKGSTEGSATGKGSTEGSATGKGSTEGSAKGKGSTEGSAKGKGSTEGSAKGKGSTEGSAKGKGSTEGSATGI